MAQGIYHVPGLWLTYFHPQAVFCTGSTAVLFQGLSGYLALDFSMFMPLSFISSLRSLILIFWD